MTVKIHNNFVEVDIMLQNKSWFKFIITGNPKDYLEYKEVTQIQHISRGEGSAYYDRWPCNKGNEYKG